MPGGVVSVIATVMAQLATLPDGSRATNVSWLLPSGR
jgi:hypothetical protein